MKRLFGVICALALSVNAFAFERADLPLISIDATGMYMMITPGVEICNNVKNKNYCLNELESYTESAEGSGDNIDVTIDWYAEFLDKIGLSSEGYHYKATYVYDKYEEKEFLYVSINMLYNSKMYATITDIDYYCKQNKECTKFAEEINESLVYKEPHKNVLNGNVADTLIWFDTTIDANK